MRDALELLHDGHALQHKLQAALPKQHAADDAREPTMHPISTSQ